MGLNSKTYAKFVRAAVVAAALACVPIPAPQARAEPKLTDLPPTVAKFIEWELFDNAASSPKSRGAIGFEMEHLEIPLKRVEAKWIDSIDADLLDSLVFDRGGEKYLRWIINPEDTAWTSQVEDYLREKRIPAKRHKRFKAYKTSSRSMVVYDPDTGAIFSAKVSTNRTGGAWQNKRLSASHARKSFLATEIAATVKNAPGKSLKLLDEPAVFVLNELPEREFNPPGGKATIRVTDQGMVVRDLKELARGGTFHLPAFSALSENAGYEIAKRNGAKSPRQVAAFWKKHFIEPLARANAEFSASSGLAFDSPHGQNFLIELDGKMRPTGKILFRDFQDSFANRGFWQESGRGDALGTWMDGFTKNNLVSGFGPLFAGESSFDRLPSWLSRSEYVDWAKGYHRAFEERFSELTGVPLRELRAVPFSKPDGLRYNWKSYPESTLRKWHEKAAELPRPVARTPSGNLPYTARPAIAEIPPKALAPKTAPKDWAKTRQAMLRYLVELLALYPDETIYFLARDGEYLHDLAKALLGENTDRVRLLNVSAKNADSPALKAYLEQEGLSKGALAKRRAILVDTGYSGSNIEKIRKSVGRERVLGHLILSQNDGLPSGRVFVEAITPKVLKRDITEFHDVVYRFEQLPHYTPKSDSFEKVDGKWVPVSAGHGDDPEDFQQRSRALMADLRAFAEDPKTAAEFDAIRDAMAELVEGAQGRKNLSKERVQALHATLKKRGIQSFYADLFEAAAIGNIASEPDAFEDLWNKRPRGAYPAIQGAEAKRALVRSRADSSCRRGLRGELADIADDF